MVIVWKYKNDNSDKTELIRLNGLKNGGKTLSHRLSPLSPGDRIVDRDKD